MKVQPSTLHVLWQSASAQYGPDPALFGPDGWTATYADVTAAAGSIADSLRRSGLRPGQAVVMDLSRGPIWLPALLGVWQAGGVTVPTRDGDPTGRRIAASHTAAALWLHDGTTAIDRWPNRYDVDVIEPDPSAWPACTTAAHAYVLSTSGSTGEPKLTAVTHASSAAVISGLRSIVPIAAGERALHTADFTFSSSIRQLLLPLLGGAAVSIFEREDRFDPSHLLQVAHEFEITMLDLTPSQLTAVTRWLEIDRDAPVPFRLQRLLVASEAFPPSLLARWVRVVPHGHSVFHLYGQTEVGGAISALPLRDTAANDPTERLPLAMPFAPFTPTLLERSDGLAELAISGLSAHDGYLTANSLATHQQARSDATDAGLYHTGDLFAQRGDGTLAFHGRADSEVKILGTRIDTLMLEHRIRTIPGVDHAAVLPVAGPDGSTVLCIAYTTADGSNDEVAARVGEAAQYQLGPAVPIPALVRLDIMPFTASGKIDRAALVHLLPRKEAATPSSSSDVVAALWRRFVHRVDGQDLSEEQDFFAAGGHSLLMLELLAEVRRHFGVRVLPEQFHKQPTLAGLRSLVRDNAPTGLPAPQRGGESEAGDAGEMVATPLQRQIWIAEQLASSGDHAPFWLPIDMHVSGTVDGDRLGNAFRLVAARFDVLRVNFTRHQGTLVIVPEAVRASELTVQSIDTVDGDGHDRLLPPMTANGPLLRLGIANERDGASIRLRIHHAIVDRSSLGTLLVALADAYAAPAAFASAPAAPSFLAWHARRSAATPPTDREAAAAFWIGALPARPSTDMQLGAPHLRRCTLSVPSLRASNVGATSHAMWLWAYRLALAAHDVRQPDLIGVDVDLREQGDRGLVGPCVTSLPIVIPADVLATGQRARAVMAALSRVLPHRFVPIQDVVPADRRPTGDPRQPFFRNSLVYQPDPYPQLHFGGQVVSYRRLPAGVATNTLTLYVRNTGNGTLMEVAWDSRVLTEHVARGILTTTAETLGLLDKD